MWEKEQSLGRRGKIVAQMHAGKNRTGRKAGGSGDSLSAVKPDHQRKGGLQPLSPIITCKSQLPSVSKMPRPRAASRQTGRYQGTACEQVSGNTALATVCVLEWSLTGFAGGKHVPWQDNV